jgi:uncharacterized protein (DUF305 family)
MSMFRMGNHNRVKAGGALLLVLLLTISGLAARPAAARPAQQTGGGMDQLKGLSGKDFEIAFLSMMIQHHQDAVDMGNMALKAAKHSEVKTAAQQIIDDQTREIGEMKGWLQQWYSMSPQPDMMAQMANMNMGMMQKLQGLTEDAFDQEFLTQMRQHHQDAITMAALVPDRATHAELKTLAQNIITAQTAERQEFADWLKAWYNVTVTDSPMAGGTMAGGTMAGGTMAGGTMPQTGASDGLMGLAWLVPLAFLCLIAGAVLLRNRWGRKEV